MGLSHAPRVITDGLVLGLDAANTRSYVGSGTTWTDLIGSNNGTLTNGPVFTQEPKLEPFGGAGAVSFDGSGDYLNISSHSDHDLGSGDFTVEGWFKTSATIAYQTIIQKYYGPGAYNGWNIALDSAGTGLTAAVFNGSNVQVDLFGGSNLNDGAWHHFALSRSGTDLRLFVDGALTDSTTNSFNITATADLQIGRHFTVSFRDWNGQLSNIRILKGTALYTSNFTPPRKKLEATSDTVLLTCEKGTIKDRSSSAHAITINGNAKSISGASYFEFDGVDDYVSGNLSTLTSWSMCIWYLSTDITSNYVFYPFSCNNAANGLGFGGTNDSTTNGRWYFFDGTNVLSSTNTAVTTNVWYNLVVTKSSTTYNLYTNGSLSLNTSGVDLNCTLYSLGRRGNGEWYAKGNIAQASIYNRALTAAEVSQNFNALRGRYGI